MRLARRSLAWLESVDRFRDLSGLAQARRLDQGDRLACDLLTRARPECYVTCSRCFHASSYPLAYRGIVTCLECRQALIEVVGAL